MLQGNVRAAALEALTKDQKKQLAAYAKIVSGGTGEESDDLLQGAFERWLASDVPVEGPAQTINFVLGAIKSIRWNIFKHKKVVRKYEGEQSFKQEDEDEDPLDNAPDSSASTEGPLFVQQIYDECGDEEIQLLLTAQADNATREEIRAEFGWDETKYEAVRKRKRRLVIRLMREGKLK
jgi:DNA-directed RNA polymerase specialized sigma24 family protein